MCYLHVSHRVKGDAGVFPEAVLLPCSLSVHLPVQASSRWALSGRDAGQVHTVLPTGPPSVCGPKVHAWDGGWVASSVLCDCCVRAFSVSSECVTLRSLHTARCVLSLTCATQPCSLCTVYTRASGSQRLHLHMLPGMPVSGACRIS